MYEVELKVRADHERVRTALTERDADALGGVVQADTYYDAPHRDFAETDEALRIRREWDGADAESSGDDGNSEVDDPAVDPAAGDPDVRVTYKGPLLEAASKSREEHETGVADGEAFAAVLEGLGFEPAATVRKARERFAVDGYTVTLDRVDGLDTFVEVETETEDDDIEAAREGAREVLASLGLDPDEQIRTSYLGLLLAGEE